MKRIVALWLIVVLGVWLPSACRHEAQSGATSGEAKTPATRGGGSVVRMIDLPRYQANLPAGPGREAFAVACLTCHTTRYITMQPPLTPAKWEESVRKMMKVYVAPVAEDQVQPVVQYIVAALASDPGPWETPAVVAKPTKSSTAGSIESANPADVAVHGTVLYAANCASCHGRRGDAQTPAAMSMLPRPTDLTASAFAPQAIEAAIVKGVSGTAMPGYANLSKQDVRDLATFTESLSSERTQPSPSASDASAATLYAQNCARCHGTTGQGDGIAAPPLARPPANFKLVRPSVAQATRVIADGVPGAAMPPWKTKLSEPQRTALAQYVRSFYPPPR